MCASIRKVASCSIPDASVDKRAPTQPKTNACAAKSVLTLARPGGAASDGRCIPTSRGNGGECERDHGPAPGHDAARTQGAPPAALHPPSST